MMKIIYKVRNATSFFYTSNWNSIKKFWFKKKLVKSFYNYRLNQSEKVLLWKTNQTRKTYTPVNPWVLVCRRVFYGPASLCTFVFETSSRVLFSACPRTRPVSSFLVGASPVELQTRERQSCPRLLWVRLVLETCLDLRHRPVGDHRHLVTKLRS